MGKRETRCGRRNLQKKETRKRKKWENILTIGVSTTWRRLSTSPLTASSGSSASRSRRRSPRRPNLLLLPLQPPCPQFELCRTYGHHGWPEKWWMMVRASMHLLHISSMHGWADLHRTRHHHLPSPSIFTFHQCLSNSAFVRSTYCYNAKFSFSVLGSCKAFKQNFAISCVSI